MDLSDILVTPTQSLGNSSAAEFPRVHITRSAAIFISLLGLFNFVFGLICNSLVITTILRTKSLVNSSINRAVLSLCCADLITVVVDQPLLALTLIGNFYGYMVISAGGVVPNCSALYFYFVVALVQHWFLPRPVLFSFSGGICSNHGLSRHRSGALLFDKSPVRKGETFKESDISKW
jgi:hypothetical protein